MSYLVTTVHSKGGIPTMLVFQVYGAPLPFKSIDVTDPIRSMSFEVNGYDPRIDAQEYKNNEAECELQWSSCYELVQRIWSHEQSGRMPTSWSRRIVEFIMKATRDARDEMSLST